MTVQEKIDKYILSRVDVKIEHTDETGEWIYAVVVDNGKIENDFWLCSFTYKKYAVAFCRDNKLKINK